MKKSLVSIALIAVMFFQLNHLAVMNLTSSHDAASQCATQQKQNSEKCLCCVIEQADKAKTVATQPIFNLVSALPQKPNFIHQNFPKNNPENKPKKNYFQQNKWLKTVVQNK